MVKTFLARIVGLLEMIGLRYPVKRYMARVSPELWRGSRLDRKGYEQLRTLGFKLIISFCQESDKDSELGDIKNVCLPVLDNATPTMSQVYTFIDLVKNKDNQPVYCHCEAGKGRTGTFVACYRIATGWSAEGALAEAAQFGFTLDNQILFVRMFEVDFDKKREAGDVKL